MRIFRVLLLGLLISGPGKPIFADEGMWMPHQMRKLNLTSLGLQMDPSDLYKRDGTGLMSAVVSFGGASAAFVSREGLILTNHHVAFGALQRASTRENDYIEHGFLAATKDEEISAPGYYADVLLGYDDVTEKIQAAVRPGMTYEEKYYALDAAQKKLIADAEKADRDIRARIASMYSGNQYYLYRFKRIKDIRIVYAPPQDLGFFGGDIDNWMWPRHTCDFTFMRAYVSKDNIGADFSPDNVPYQPKAIVKISLDGFKDRDFSFVMGYPGSTSRNYTVSELMLDVDYMRANIELRKDIIAFLEDAGKDDRDVQIKYADTIQSLNNYLKNYQGQLEGFEKVGLIDRKKAQEQAFRGWVDQDPARRQKYGSALDEIDDFMERYRDYYWKNQLFGRLTSARYGSALLAQAYTIFRTVEEGQKPDMDREPDYQERNLPFIRRTVELAERSYDLDVDRSLLKHQLKKLLDLTSDQVPQALRSLVDEKSEKAIENYVDLLYDGTTLSDKEKRIQYLAMPYKELTALGDPLIELAADLEKEMKALREEGKALGQERTDLKKTYLEAILQKNQGRIAPDANSTIRFTYGFFKGYRPRDGVIYDYQTTLSGVVEKDTGEFPFRVPERLKKLYAARDYGRYEDPNRDDVPACFLNSTSVTGGSSGSPTFNAKGEQIGIIFDMTYESVTADYYIIPELQRTISVDIRFVLFVTEKFSGATHIIRELGL